MDEEYDCVVLGTGLKECILSGLLSVHGMKVLHMDRNNYYGGESASLNMTQLWEKFRAGETIPELGHNRYWNVDLIPKFLLASGRLTKILVHTDVTRYLEFKVVDGSYVYSNNKMAKVPSNDMEAAFSPLVNFLEKNRARKFFVFLQDWRADDPATHKGMNTDVTPAIEVFKHFGLSQSTIDFIGHAMALYANDDYLKLPARETFRRIHLYVESTARYGKSPYIYPMYGLGELPQAFARLSAIYGGTYMLDRPIDGVEYNDLGQACGVKSDGEVAKCKFVVGDPSYFTDKVTKQGEVVRCICILSHPIPNTDDVESCQIIMPGNQIGRKNDIYISLVSSTHQVAAKGKYLALVSTTRETTAEPAQELQAGFNLLGAIDHQFFSVSDVMVPTTDGSQDKCFITTSFDASTHFQTSTQNVEELFERITGKKLDVTQRVRKTMEEEQAEYIKEQTEGQPSG